MITYQTLDVFPVCLASRQGLSHMVIPRWKNIDISTVFADNTNELMVVFWCTICSFIARMNKTLLVFVICVTIWANFPSSCQKMSKGNSIYITFLSTLPPPLTLAFGAQSAILTHSISACPQTLKLPTSANKQIVQNSIQKKDYYPLRKSINAHKASSLQSPPELHHTWVGRPGWFHYPVWATPSNGISVANSRINAFQFQHWCVP